MSEAKNQRDSVASDQRIVIRDCPECEGRREYECPHCESMMSCEYCDETGMDPEQVDTVKWSEAARQFTKANSMTCDWIVDGVMVGRRAVSGPNRLKIRPFLRSG